MRRIRTLAAVSAAALSIGVGTASAAHIGRPSSATFKQASGAIRALSVVPGDGRADVVIALTGPVKVADFTIEAPDRIVLRSEEHTSELQSRLHLVCRLL